MNKITGVHHICLKAAEQEQWEKAVNFYTQVLGCPLVRSWGEGERSGAMLDLGNCLLEIFADAAQPLAPGVHRHVAFRTNDVDGAVELVRRAGCQITMEPVDKCLGADYPVRIAFCWGPAGESIEFFQER